VPGSGEKNRQSLRQASRVEDDVSCTMLPFGRSTRTSAAVAGPKSTNHVPAGGGWLTRASRRCFPAGRRSPTPGKRWKTADLMSFVLIDDRTVVGFFASGNRVGRSGSGCRCDRVSTERVESAVFRLFAVGWPLAFAVRRTVERPAIDAARRFRGTLETHFLPLGVGPERDPNAGRNAFRQRQRLPRQFVVRELDVGRSASKPKEKSKYGADRSTSSSAVPATRRTLAGRA